jgi:hypothetical protein
MVSFAIVDVVDVEIPRLFVDVTEVPVGTVGIDLERLPDVENLADVRFLIAVEVLDAGWPNHFERAELAVLDPDDANQRPLTVPDSVRGNHDVLEVLLGVGRRRDLHQSPQVGVDLFGRSWRVESGNRHSGESVV